MSYDTLVTVQTLEQHLFEADWCIVDCRHDLTDGGAGFRAYQQGHVPGAAFAHIDEDLSGRKSGRNGRHPLPARDDLAALFREWGIGNDTQIVAYDAHGGQFAGRLWWLARWLGHDQVAVLDGGWQAWLERTNWSSTEEPDRPEGRFEPRSPRAATVDADTVAGLLVRGDRQLLDARAAERFRGEQEPIDPVAGHIPGALNRFWQDNLDGGRFKSRERLRAEFDAVLNGRPPSALVHYCGSGISAAHNALSMQIAGLAGSALYPGSWSEWISEAARPVATGPNP
jgi:thiosulfate/3-mercaptopyruvate sulfurtransferase